VNTVITFGFWRHGVGILVSVEEEVCGQQNPRSLQRRSQGRNVDKADRRPADDTTETRWLFATGIIVDVQTRKWNLRVGLTVPRELSGRDDRAGVSKMLQLAPATKYS
jgi:hypothetical protein